MHISIIIYGIFVGSIQVLVSVDGCTDTGKTVERVQGCPQIEQAWREAAARKNCGGFPHSCPSFVYHCVMNTWQNETVEVCAPRQQIVGNSCVEYNFLGTKVQRNRNVKCAECPKVYNSTESFKYQECYPNVRSGPANPSAELDHELTTSLFRFSTTTQRNTQPTSSVTTEESKNTTKNQSDGEKKHIYIVIAVVCVVGAVIAMSIAVVVIHNRRKKSRDPEDKDYHEPLKSSDKTTNETVAV